MEPSWPVGGTRNRTPFDASDTRDGGFASSIFHIGSAMNQETMFAWADPFTEVGTFCHEVAVVERR
jgi:hypothetical protein